MNLDRRKHFPHQYQEGRFNFCVGETVSDILANVHDQAFDPDFSYAGGLAIQGKPASDGGLQPYAAMLAACAYGALPERDDISDPLDTSALHEADFRSYTTEQKQHAAYYTANGVMTLYGYDAVTEYLLTRKQGVALAMKWYSSFNHPYSDGTLKAPSKDDTFTYHCVAVYEATDKGLRLKPWLGEDYGLHGYGFLPRSLYAQCYPTGYGFDKGAWRWATLVKIGLMYPKTLPTLLPIIYSSSKI